MQHYKTIENNLYAIEPEFAGLLPQGCVPISDEEANEIRAAINMNLPQSPKQFTSLEYLDLFSESEQLAVVTATMAVPQVKLWYDKMLAAGFITSADPRTEGGLAALVGAGLLTEARKVEILAVMA